MKGELKTRGDFIGNQSGIPSSGNSRTIIKGNKTKRKKKKTNQTSEQINSALSDRKSKEKPRQYSVIASTDPITSGTDESEECLHDMINDTLRWDNVCSDSDEELERIQRYKANRRKRFTDALEARVMNELCKR